MIDVLNSNRYYIDSEGSLSETSVPSLISINHVCPQRRAHVRTTCIVRSVDKFMTPLKNKQQNRNYVACGTRGTSVTFRLLECVARHFARHSHDNTHTLRCQRWCLTAFHVSSSIYWCFPSLTSSIAQSQLLLRNTPFICPRGYPLFHTQHHAKEATVRQVFRWDAGKTDFVHSVRWAGTAIHPEEIPHNSQSHTLDTSQTTIQTFRNHAGWYARRKKS